MVPFFEFGKGVFWISVLDEDEKSDPWTKLGVNLAGGLAIVAWSGFWSVVIFGILKATNLLRIDRDIEFQGMDAVKHGKLQNSRFLFSYSFKKFQLLELLFVHLFFFHMQVSRPTLLRRGLSCNMPRRTKRGNSRARVRRP